MILGIYVGLQAERQVESIIGSLLPGKAFVHESV
jgi:hypothetical protein